MSFVDNKSLFPVVFFKDKFEIDDYLSKCTQKSDLTTLRVKLRNYGQEVYGDMIQILKSETDNIVTLAESLTNLNISINNLTIPIAQLKEEIRALYTAIHTSKLCFMQQLDIANRIGVKRDLMNLRIGILSSLTYIKQIIESCNGDQDITVLERAVNEYSFQYLYSCQLGIEEIIQEDFVSSIAKELIELIDMVFLKALRSNNNDIILRCLQMYSNLEKQKEAEEFVKKNIVRPVVSKIFTVHCLEKHDNNMKILYDRALAVLNVDMKSLTTVLDRNPNIKGFDFVINSYWMEVDMLLCENLPNITAPGNPEFFQCRYKHTQHFLEQILLIAKKPHLYKTNPTFDAHMKRFNLPVYFEIRFQQITANFEAELLLHSSNFKELKVLQSGVFKLKISATLWNCIETCFHEDVFLLQLADQIFKLSMLLTSRYIIWYNDFVKWPSFEDSVCYELEKFVMYSLMDIASLKSYIGYSSSLVSSFDHTAFKIVPVQLQPALFKILKLNNESLDHLIMKLQEDFAKFKIKHCTTLLQQVGSIPRIYRRTNRGIPQEYSVYVIEAVLPLTNFYDAYKNDIQDKIIPILDQIIKAVSDHYIELVQEVLKSVCKTEESLKRLKNRNPLSTDDSAVQPRGEGMSDETKIREQIKLDVAYFVKEVAKFSRNLSHFSLITLIEESGINVELF